MPFAKKKERDQPISKPAAVASLRKRPSAPPVPPTAEPVAETNVENVHESDGDIDPTIWEDAPPPQKAHRAEEAQPAGSDEESELDFGEEVEEADEEEEDEDPERQARVDDYYRQLHRSAKAEFGLPPLSVSIHLSDHKVDQTSDSPAATVVSSEPLDPVEQDFMEDYACVLVHPDDGARVGAEVMQRLPLTNADGTAAENRFKFDSIDTPEHSRCLLTAIGQTNKWIKRPPMDDGDAADATSTAAKRRHAFLGLALLHMQVYSRPKLGYRTWMRHLANPSDALPTLEAVHTATMDLLEKFGSPESAPSQLGLASRSVKPLKHYLTTEHQRTRQYLEHLAHAAA